jgi:hypothetical protein
MKEAFKTINIILLGVYMAGIVLVLFSLISLPDAIERASIKIDARVMREVMPVLTWRIVAVVATLVAGIGTLLMTSRRIVPRQEKSYEGGHAEDGEGAQDDGQRAAEPPPARRSMVRNIERAIAAGQAPGLKVNRWLSAVCREMEASQAVLYKGSNSTSFELFAAFAFDYSDGERLQYAPGEGLVGQSAKSDKKLILRDIPADYIKVFSGLGSAGPAALLVLPLKSGDKVVAVLEVASFTEITDQHIDGIESAFQLIIPEIREAVADPAKDRKRDQKKEIV